jgi:hypothetical protein
VCVENVPGDKAYKEVKEAELSRGRNKAAAGVAEVIADTIRNLNLG